MSYAGAGHPPLLLWGGSSKGVRDAYWKTVLFLGRFPFATYASVELPLMAGDRALLYTDGISETTNPADIQFGTDGFRQFLETERSTSADEFADRLLQELSRWSGQQGSAEDLDDDTTDGGNPRNVLKMRALSVSRPKHANALSEHRGLEISGPRSAGRLTANRKLFTWMFQELATVDGDPDGIAFAINDLGQAVGASGNCGPFNAIEQNNFTPLHAVLWRNGNAIDLGNLEGDGRFAGIYASGLNDRGQLWNLGHLTATQAFMVFFGSRATSPISEH